MKILIRTTVFFLTVSVVSCFMAPVSSAKNIKGVSASMQVKAQPETIWSVLMQLRLSKPKTRKVLSHRNNQAILEEKMLNLPIIGSATIRYVENETPYRRLDYHLISSDRFKVFQGSWVLTPDSSGKFTDVKVHSALDTGLRLPFAREITNRSTLKDLKKRLARVKRLSESKQRQAAATVDRSGEESSTSSQPAGNISTN